jgi:hypothetical protein
VYRSGLENRVPAAIPVVPSVAWVVLRPQMEAMEATRAAWRLTVAKRRAGYSHQRLLADLEIVLTATISSVIDGGLNTADRSARPRSGSSGSCRRTRNLQAAAGTGRI